MLPGKKRTSKLSLRKQHQRPASSVFQQPRSPLHPVNAATAAAAPAAVASLATLEVLGRGARRRRCGRTSKLLCGTLSHGHVPKVSRRVRQEVRVDPDMIL